MDRQRGDNEDGRQLRGSFEAGRTGTPIKGSAVLKTSDKEKRVQLSLCNEAKGKCRSGDAHFKHEHEENGDLEYSLRIVEESNISGQKSIHGVSIRTSKADNGRQMDHTVKLILNHQDSETVGYRLYKKDGHEVGAEVLLPERVIATVLDYKKAGPSDCNMDLSFYIDKTRQPNRKISLIFNTDSHKSHFGRDMEVIFRHPDIEKELKIHTKYSIVGGESNSRVFEVKTVLDIFKANNDIVVAYKATMEPGNGDGNLYTSHWSVKGQSMNFGGKSEINSRNAQVTYKQEFHYENREKQMKTAKIETMLSMNRMSFEVKGHSGKFLSLISAFENKPNGYEYRQEMFLPGMEDARY
jgi:nitrogen fixation protein FixH